MIHDLYFTILLLLHKDKDRHMSHMDDKSTLHSSINGGTCLLVEGVRGSCVPERPLVDSFGLILGEKIHPEASS